MNFKKLIISSLSLLFVIGSIAQDVNLDSLLDTEMKKKTKNETRYTEATFQTTRLINGHTVETTQKGVLDLKVQHRFGTLNSGLYNLFGLDEATIRVGVDYGITNRLTVGLGRSSFEKQYDGFLKYRLLWQSTGKRVMPVSLTLLSTAFYKTLKPSSDSIKINNSDKWYFGLQALVARKFNSSFSMQLMPTMIHYNLAVEDAPNNLYSIGVGARMKLTKHTALTAEYYYQLPNYKIPGTYNSFSLGYEIETGGHVFQLHLSNSTGMVERPFITETNGRWSKGDIHIGFNISRVFTVHRPKSISQNITPAERWSIRADTISNIKSDSTTQYAIATFKTDHLINGHSVETTQKGVLDVKIQHRFGTLNQGFYNWFGLDQATERIGFDYGLTNRLEIGGGRSSFEKEYDAFLKYRLLWQSNGEKKMPVSVTLLAAMSVKTLKETVDSIKIQTSDRFYYVYQAMIARKFGKAFSFQVSPTLIHYNIVPTSETPNDLISIGFGARLQLTPRSSLLAEYFYQLPDRRLPGSYNSFSIGYEIETGGHVFHFHFTNSTGMTERTFINETTGQWKDGDIHFGFNIARVFTVAKPKTVQ